jgi:hypothetical protein
MFIHSDCQLPAKVDLQVEVSLHSVANAVTGLRMSAQGLVVRVKPPQALGYVVDLQSSSGAANYTTALPLRIENRIEELRRMNASEQALSRGLIGSTEQSIDSVCI